MKSSVKAISRINRIRLEFKVIAMIGAIVVNTVLIESDWNLKLQHPKVLMLGICINRIRLEFKDISLTNALTGEEMY